MDEKTLTMKDFEEKKYEVLREKLQYKWCYNATLGHGGYTSECTPDDTLLDELAEKYPFSGVEQIDFVARRYYYNSADDYENTRKILYYKAYSEMPQLEQIVKAGYGHIVSDAITSSSNLQILKRNFKPGKNIKEITGIPTFAMNAFKTEITTLSEWNEMRVLVQKYLTTKEQLDAYLALGYRYNMRGLIDKCKWLLNSGYYTTETLFGYLNRVDIYQAIEPDEATVILKDYINMCKELGVEPDTKTNSLKREHDVMMRNYYNNRTEMTNRDFEDAVKEYKKFEYSSKRYSIIAPVTAEDLYKEGRMQRNCVGSYVSSVAKKNSIILFLRNTANIEHSFVTVEIDPKDYHIRQKYMSCNRPITDKNVLNFLDKWEEKIKSA